MLPMCLMWFIINKTKGKSKKVKVSNDCHLEAKREICYIKAD
jgi:hypothetical protein